MLRFSSPLTVLHFRPSLTLLCVVLCRPPLAPCDVRLAAHLSERLVAFALRLVERVDRFGPVIIGALEVNNLMDGASSAEDQSGLD